MDFTKMAPGLSTRLNKGNMLLRNAQTLDTKPVKARLSVFTATHRSYIEAIAKVEEAIELERGEAKIVEELDIGQDKAVEELTIALINDHEPRRAPLGRFSDYSPSEIIDMAFGDEAKAIHALVLAVKSDDRLSQKARSIADRAEAAALKVEAALPGLETRRAYLAGVRQERDNLGVQWDSHYAALRFFTKSLVDTPALYERLFLADSRLSRKGKAPSQPASEPNAPPAQAAAPTA